MRKIDSEKKKEIKTKQRDKRKKRMVITPVHLREGFKKEEKN